MDDGRAQEPEASGANESCALTERRLVKDTADSGWSGAGIRVCPTVNRPDIRRIHTQTGLCNNVALVVTIPEVVIGCNAG